MSVLFTCCRSHTCSCCSSSWCTWWWCNTAASLQPQAGQVITRVWLLRQSSRTWAILLQAASSKKLRNQSPQPPNCSCPNFPKLYRCTSGRVHKALVNMTEKVDGKKSTLDKKNTHPAYVPGMWNNTSILYRFPKAWEGTQQQHLNDG